MKIVSLIFLKHLSKFSYWQMLLFFILFNIQSCSAPENPKAIDPNFISIEEGEDVEIIFSEDGVPTVKVLAPVAVRYNLKPPEVPYTQFPSGLTLEVFNKEGGVNSTLTADEGKMTDGNKDLEVKKNVHILNSKGEELKTDHLVWNKDSKKISSDGFVKILTNNEIISGNGFIADENFTNYTIFDISGIVKVRDSEF